MRTWRSLGSIREFKRVYRSGQASTVNGVTVYVANAEPGRRAGLGLVVRGALGTAVQRNRIRRRLRAAFTECRPDGVDVVIRVDRWVEEMEFQLLVRELRTALAEGRR